jgi:hypothetical protein
MLVGVIEEKRDTSLPLDIHASYRSSSRWRAGELTDSHPTVSLGDEQGKVATQTNVTWPKMGLDLCLGSQGAKKSIAEGNRVHQRGDALQDRRSVGTVDCEVCLLLPFQNIRIPIPNSIMEFVFVALHLVV